MDKKSYTGLILIFAVMAVFYWINQPSEEQRRQWQAYHDSIAHVQAMKADSIRLAEAAKQMSKDTIEYTAEQKAEQLVAKYGKLADAAEGSEEETILENGKIKVYLTSKGAKINSVEIKNYKDQNGNDVRLFDGANNKFGFNFTHNTRYFFTNDLYFKHDTTIVTADSTQIVRYNIGSGEGELAFVYTLANDSYEVGFDIESRNMGDIISVNGAALDLDWNIDMRAQEKGHKSEGLWSAVYYRYDSGDVEDLSAAGNQSEEVNMNLDWVAFKDQYFSSILVANQKFAGARLSSEAKAETDSIIKHVEARLGVKYNFYENSKASFKFIFVPNYFYTLDSFEGMQFTDLLPLGWGIFGWVNEYAIIPIFKFLESFMSNYGLIILVLTIIIKMVLMPLMYKSYQSQAKMRVLKPQIEAINEKIPADKAMERQQETMKLYKKAGVSPMAGCLPMLLQMPVLFAAFRFFPAAVELRGQSFLWADDLATYDSILDLPFSIPFYGDHVSLFCLLMSIVNVFYTKMNMAGQTSNGMPGMKFMTYFMPVMFLFILNDYPAGLCYYYFVSSLITIIINTVIKEFFIDEKAILAQIEANKKKPAKQSAWSRRMEELMKESQKKR